MTRFRYALAALCLVQAASVSAQLPELANPSAASGASTTARFFAGASADNGATYSSVHGYADPIDLLTEIQVESAHVNTVGNLYVIIQLDGLYFMGLESGEYVVWDLSGETLQPIRAATTLQASEPLTLVDDVAFGPAGVSDTSLDVYLAYDTTANPGELYYSGVPLTFSIEAQVQQLQSLTLYQNNISAPIIQAKCISCHVSGGLAGGTPLTYVSSSQPDYMQTNYNTLVAYMEANQANGASELKSNPQGTSHGGGVQLQADSTELDNWIEFVNTLEAEVVGE